ASRKNAGWLLSREDRVYLVIRCRGIDHPCHCLDLLFGFDSFISVRNSRAFTRSNSVLSSSETPRTQAKQGCYRSSEMGIVAPSASSREIFSRKTEIATRKEKEPFLKI